jgi:hypothetical protein
MHSWSCGLKSWGTGLLAKLISKCDAGKFFIFDVDIQGKEKRALLGTCFIYLEEDNFIAPLKNVKLYVFSNHVTTFGTQTFIAVYNCA